MKKFAKMMAMAVMATVLLVGCGKPTSLEEALQNSESASDKIQEMATDSGVSIEVKENTITYTYNLGRELDEDTKALVVEQLEEKMAGYDDSFIAIAQGLEESTEITGITVEVRYVDSNGAEVYHANYNATERVSQ
ncbi:MAG: DUF4854 domain-containing protein [Lachnospiraceae bacterium]|nr:DUF4854 domain-containing protein [Lachnospiraceae bacterium]